MPSDLKKVKHHIFLLFLLSFTSFCSYSQLTITPDNVALNLAQSLAGPGITITNAQLTAPNASMTATFTAAGGAGTNLGMNAGILLCTGPASQAIGPNSSGSTGQDMGGAGISQLNSLASSQTYDGVILSFDFVPLSSTVSFRYVFASEEWPEWVGSSFNDAFAFFISGPGIAGQQNLAVVPGTNTPITINTVNSGGNSGYYVNNNGGQWISFDAFTTVMTATNTANVQVTPCLTYHLDLMIADGGDGIWDSGVFLEQGSLTSGQISISTSAAPTNIPGGGGTALPDSVSWEGCNNASITFTLSQATNTPTVVSFTIGGTATNGVDYQQLPTSVTIPAGQLSASLQLIPLTDGVQEGIETVLFNTGTSTCSTTVNTLYINDVIPPSIVVSNDTSFCIGGDSITLRASATGSSGFFLFNWGSAAAANYYFDTLNVLPSATTTYTVTATDYFCQGNTASEQITVTVNNLPIADAGFDGSYCSGNGVTLSANGGISYQWYEVSSNLAVGNGTNNITVFPTGQATYEVEVSNGNCTDRDTVVFSELPSPIADAGQDVSICPGGTTTLTGSGGINYQWFPVTNLTVTNQATTDATPAVQTQYNLIVTDANGCSDTDDVTVFIWNLPTVDAGADVSVCFGDGTSLSASGAQTYDWQPNIDLSANNIANPNFTGTNTITYTVTGTDANGCQNTDDVTVFVIPLPIASFTLPTQACVNEQFDAVFNGTASPAATAIWSFGTLNEVGGQNLGPITLLSAQAGNQVITLTIQEGTCTSLPVTEQITIYPYPVADAGPDVAFCSGETTTLGSPSVPSQTYQWSPSTDLSNATIGNPSVSILNPGNSIQTQTYTITTTENGCSSTNDVIVTIYPIPFAAFTPPAGQCLAGNSFSFRGEGTFGSGASFEWDFGINSSPASSTNQIPTGIQYSQPGTYTVQFTITENGCESSPAIEQLTVYPMPVADFTVADDEGCVPYTARFTNASTSVDPLLLTDWIFYDTEEATSSQNDPNYTFQTPGTYDVYLSIETVNGCRDSILKPQFVTARPNPVAMFRFTENPVDMLNPSVGVIDESVGAISCSYELPDLSIKDSCNFAITLNDTGIFCYLLNVVNEFGCTDSTERCLIVLPAYSFWVPNAFTPNNRDGNEVFTPKALGVLFYEMRIYNRWGQQVFRSLSIDNGWDGTVEGQPAQMDVYAYEIDVVDYAYNYRNYRGRVTLCR